MKALIFLVIPIFVAGCAAGPARGQPESESVVNERLNRMTTEISDQSDRILTLTERLTDARFAEVKAEIAELKADNDAKFKELEEKIDTNHREQLAKLDKLEEGQQIPWLFALGTGLVGGVGGTGGTMLVRRTTNGKSHKNEEQA